MGPDIYPIWIVFLVYITCKSAYKYFNYYGYLDYDCDKFNCECHDDDDSNNQMIKRQFKNNIVYL